MSVPCYDLTGRRALVTGASRGIGLAVARSLAAAGARVALHCRSVRPQAEAALAGLPGRDHVLLAADLQDGAAAAALPDRAARALGGLDLVVNNAGIFESHDVCALDPDAWRRAWERTLAINLTAPAAILHAAVPHLTAAGGGHLVNVTSRGAFRGEPGAPAYGASKAGLNSLGQSLALRLAPLGIHVVAVAPGWVRTDMTAAYLDGPEGAALRAQSPLNRTAEADEVAAVVLLAVSGRADALTGGIIDVNCASYLRT